MLAKLNFFKWNFLKQDEKSSAAFSSVLAALFLVTLKLIVGISTGSLGILSEALHSSLDFLAAAVTLLAVKTSGKPADKEHQYGHGKIENLSALFETLLLLLTVLWIIFEATRRILFQDYHVDANIYAFGVMIIAIIVDVSRAKLLSTAAKKHDSQALKADALHFSTDVLSSSVVIFGLIFTKLGYPIGDPLAAIGVAMIVLWISLQLGKESIEDLLDKAPKGLSDQIKLEASLVKGVTNVERVRIRKSGPNYFVDLIITTDPKISVDESYLIIDQIQHKIKSLLTNHSDILIHIEPQGQEYNEEILSTIKSLVDEEKAVIHSHDYSLITIGNTKHLLFNIELDEHLSYQQAYSVSTKLKQAIKERDHTISDILIHIEPFIGQKHAQYDHLLVENTLISLVKRSKHLSELVKYEVHQITPSSYSLFLKCTTNSEYRLRRVHKAVTELEDSIKEVMPFFSKIVIEAIPE